MKIYLIYPINKFESLNYYAPDRKGACFNSDKNKEFWDFWLDVFENTRGHTRGQALGC